MRSASWILGGAASILVGLTIWFTAFVLVPLGVVLVVVGIVTAARNRARLDRSDGRR
jgi:hypothetical protein